MYSIISTWTSLLQQFFPLFTAPGVTVYEELGKDVNAEVFVQVVDLAAGAGVELLHGPIILSGRGGRLEHGRVPILPRLQLGDLYRRWLRRQPGAAHDVADCGVVVASLPETFPGRGQNRVAVAYPVTFAFAGGLCINL